MIENLELQKLPYVDGMPDEGQTRIDWIKNGERVCAATTPTSNDGTLNRPTVQVQSNCVLLNNNDDTIKEKVNEVITVVNNIDATLGQMGDTQLIDLVHADNVRIQHLEQQGIITDNRISDVERDITHIFNGIGERDPADKSKRTVMGELYFQKKEMGSYPGFDMDGLPDVTNPGSGMKYRIAQTSLALATYDQRITRLEDEFVTSDVGNLTIQIDKLRTEIGPESSATGINLYLRMTAVENRSTSNETDVTKLKTIVDFSNSTPLKDRVSSLEIDYDKLADAVNAPNSGLVAKVGLLENVVGDATTPGTVVAEIGRLDAADDQMFAIIGHTDSEGIRGQMADLNTLIGSDQTPNSVLGRMSSVETKANALAVEVNQLEQTVGSSSSGLVAANILISHDIYGNPSAPGQLEKDGIKQTVAQHDAELKNNVIKKPNDNLPYYIQHGALTPFANIAVDLRALNKTVTLPDEHSHVAVALSDATAEFLRNAILNDPSIQVSQSGDIKIDCAFDLTGVSDTAEYAAYIVITDSTGSSQKRSIAALPISKHNTSQVFNIKGIVAVEENDRITLKIGAVDSASAGEITINHIDIIITPVM